MIELMKIEDFVKGLHSKMRRRILKLLCQGDKTAMEVYLELGNGAPKYRQSVNKCLETLHEYGFVEKYYDQDKKALYYGIVKKKYDVDVEKMGIK